MGWKTKINLQTNFDNVSSNKNFRKLIPLKNVYDSISDQEDHNDFNKSVRLMDESSFFRKFWNLFILSAIIYSATIGIFRYVFYPHDAESFLFYYEIIIDMAFICEIILQFFTPIYEKNKVYYDKSSIAIHYLKSWFFLDLITSAPLTVSFLINDIMLKNSILDYDQGRIDLNINLLRQEERIKNKNIFFGHIYNHNFIFNKSNLLYSEYITNNHICNNFYYNFFRWVRVLKLIKIFTYDKSLSANDFSFIKRWKSLGYFKIGFIFILLVHISSCLWIFIGGLDDSQLLSSWYKSLNDYWEMNSFDIYVASVYFNLLTIYSVGYGDIVSKNFRERITNIFILTVGNWLFSFGISYLSFLFGSSNLLENKYKTKIKILEKIKKKYDVPHNLYRQMKRSVKNMYTKVHMEKFIIYESLPLVLKRELILSMYKKGISNLIFFKYSDKEFIVSVLPLLTTHNLLKDDILVSAGGIIEEIYIVNHGILSVCLDNSFKNIQISQLKRNYHFGDILIYLNEKSPYLLKCSTKSCEYLTLSKADYYKIGLIFDKIIMKILEFSCEFLENIEKTKQVIVALFDEGKNSTEIKTLIKSINYFLSKLDFQNIFYGDKNTEPLSVEDFFAYNDIKDIIQFSQTSMTEKNFNNIFAEFLNEEKLYMESISNFNNFITFNQNLNSNCIINPKKRFSTDKERLSDSYINTSQQKINLNNTFTNQSISINANQNASHVQNKSLNKPLNQPSRRNSYFFREKLLTMGNKLKSTENVNNNSENVTFYFDKNLLKMNNLDGTKIMNPNKNDSVLNSFKFNNQMNNTVNNNNSHNFSYNYSNNNSHINYNRDFNSQNNNSFLIGDELATAPKSRQYLKSENKLTVEDKQFKVNDIDIKDEEMKIEEKVKNMGKHIVKNLKNRSSKKLVTESYTEREKTSDSSESYNVDLYSKYNTESENSLSVKEQDLQICKNPSIFEKKRNNSDSFENAEADFTSFFKRPTKKDSSLNTATKKFSSKNVAKVNVNKTTTYGSESPIKDKSAIKNTIGGIKNLNLDSEKKTFDEYKNFIIENIDKKKRYYNVVDNFKKFLKKKMKESKLLGEKKTLSIFDFNKSADQNPETINKDFNSNKDNEFKISINNNNINSDVIHNSTNAIENSGYIRQKSNQIVVDKCETNQDNMTSSNRYKYYKNSVKCNSSKINSPKINKDVSESNSNISENRASEKKEKKKNLKRPTSYEENKLKISMHKNPLIRQLDDNESSSSFQRKEKTSLTLSCKSKDKGEKDDFTFSILKPSKTFSINTNPKMIALDIKKIIEQNKKQNEIFEFDEENDSHSIESMKNKHKSNIEILNSQKNDNRLFSFKKESEISEQVDPITSLNEIKKKIKLASASKDSDKKSTGKGIKSYSSFSSPVKPREKDKEKISSFEEITDKKDFLQGEKNLLVSHIVKNRRKRLENRKSILREKLQLLKFNSFDVSAISQENNYSDFEYETVKNFKDTFPLKKTLSIANGIQHIPSLKLSNSNNKLSKKINKIKLKQENSDSNKSDRSSNKPKNSKAYKTPLNNNDAKSVGSKNSQGKPIITKNKKKFHQEELINETIYSYEVIRGTVFIDFIFPQKNNICFYSEKKILEDKHKYRHDLQLREKTNIYSNANNFQLLNSINNMQDSRRNSINEDNSNKTSSPSFKVGNKVSNNLVNNIVSNNNNNSAANPKTRDSEIKVKEKIKNDHISRNKPKSKLHQSLINFKKIELFDYAKLRSKNMEKIVENEKLENDFDVNKNRIKDLSNNNSGDPNNINAINIQEQQGINAGFAYENLNKNNSNYSLRNKFQTKLFIKDQIKNLFDHNEQHQQQSANTNQTNDFSPIIDHNNYSSSNNINNINNIVINQKNRNFITVINHPDLIKKALNDMNINSMQNNLMNFNLNKNSSNNIRSINNNIHKTNIFTRNDDCGINSNALFEKEYILDGNYTNNDFIKQQNNKSSKKKINHNNENGNINYNNKMNISSKMYGLNKPKHSSDSVSTKSIFENFKDMLNKKSHEIKKTQMVNKFVLFDESSLEDIKEAENSIAEINSIHNSILKKDENIKTFTRNFSNVKYKAGNGTDFSFQFQDIKKTHIDQKNTNKRIDNLYKLLKKGNPEQNTKITLEDLYQTPE